MTCIASDYHDADAIDFKSYRMYLYVKKKKDTLELWTIRVFVAHSLDDDRGNIDADNIFVPIIEHVLAECCKIKNTYY